MSSTPTLLQGAILAWQQLLARFRVKDAKDRAFLDKLDVEMARREAIKRSQNTRP